MFEVDLILKLARNPNDYQTAITVGDWYFSLGQMAAAFMWYCKAADNHPDTKITSQLLVKAAECMAVGGKRRQSALTLLLHAKEADPSNLDTYIMISKWYESCSYYHQAYDYALQGLSVTRAFDQPEKVAMLLFQQAVCSWWIGKEQQSRDLFVKLKDQYVNFLTPEYRDLVQNNLIRIGVNSRSHDQIAYDPNVHHFDFDGIETVQSNYSQALQDLFVLQELNGKRGGTFLEVGSADPVYRNNTWLLESKFDWRGVAIDYNQQHAAQYNEKRKSPCICEDATSVDYEALCSSLADSQGIIDYLQLDCEPAAITLQVLKKIPFDRYKFRVITFEHDDYIDITKSCRKESRQYLTQLGYQLKVADVCVDGSSVNSFEDWWIYPC